MFRPTRFIVASLILSTLLHAEIPTPYNTEKGSPMPAEEAAATMELPEGFKCVVFAAEPDVQQPIAMNWDSKGRLWVAECYTYAEQPDRWDTNLRDRVLIFEDKDGDGRHDVRKVFWEGGTYLTSVEVGYGGVWVLHNGTLSFIADKNGDDVPDGEPEVLLDGFNTKTIGHNIVNGLRWGPDGWLYGRHGITDTSAVGAPGTPMEMRTKLNCAIWRYHPTRKVFEVVCHGGTNAWGHDWNADGELFYINTVIGHLWHAIPGAYYGRMFGTHLNPHVYEVIEQTADHFHWDAGSEKWSDIRGGITNKTSDLGGGHAHVGMLIYQGGLWPERYHGAVLTCNLHGRRINMDTLHREGCGYVGKHAPDFMMAKDPWFRGIELLTGPDGNVFVADWSDNGECHDNDGIHRTSGRIYKIVYGGNASAISAARPGLPSTASDRAKAYFDVLGSNVSYFIRSHFLNLQDASQYSGVVEPDHAALNELLQSSCAPIAKLRALSCFHFSGGVPSELVNHLWDDADELLIPWLIDNSIEAARFLPLASKSKSGLVRLHLAAALQRLPLAARWPIATALAKHEEDANDRQQPLMIWYGIEPAVAADPMTGVELVREAKIPTVRRLVTRRIVEEIETQPEAVKALVALATEDSERRGDVIRGMSEALQGWSKAPKPEGWDALASKITDEDSKELVQQLSTVFGSGRPMEELIPIVSDTDADASARRSAFASLTRTPSAEVLKVIRTLINDKVLGVESRTALAAYDDPSVAVQLTRVWPERSIDQQNATIATLSSRASYAKALLEAVQKGTIPVKAISPYQARQIQNLGDEGVNALLAEVWGEIRETPEAKKAELEQWRGELTPEVIASADAGRGRTVFNTACAACHKLYGQGGAIGPELTGSDRHNLNYLLENILDPNAVVPADYQLTVFTLKDGRVISGVVPEENARVITVQTPAERLSIEKTEVVERKQLPVSLMPEGLLSAVPKQQVKDLFAYLMSQGQVDASP